MGAAETGSGKTLAFGLPILSGIMKLKEKAELKGLDVYDIPYKKTSVKKKSKTEVGNDNKIKKDKGKKGKLVQNKKEKEVKESSEDGYSTGEDDETNKLPPKKSVDEQNDESLVKEIEVPIRKHEESVDEGNDSDEDNYIHLSDMLDSDDLKSSDDDEDKVKGDVDEKDKNVAESGDETEGVDEVDANRQGRTIIINIFHKKGVLKQVVFIQVEKLENLTSLLKLANPFPSHQINLKIFSSFQITFICQSYIE